MKKKIIIIFSMVLFIVVCLLCILKFLIKDNDNKKVVNKKTDAFILLSKNEKDIKVKDNTIFTSYEEYKRIFNNDKLRKEDFKKYNYVLIKIEYDYCREKNIKPESYKIDGSDIDVKFTYTAKCGVCPLENMYYLLRVDKSIMKANVNIDYTANNKVKCPTNVSYKPIIYLYPEEELKVKVELGKPKLLTTTYPIYKDNWEVVAKPNGELYDNNGRMYYGLYWEGNNNISEEFNDGFVVKNENLVKFLEEKLSILGLNEREANEFIIYWLPILEKNEYNLIRFADIKVINKEMPLKVSPNPDTIIRVLMEYKPISKPIKVKKQVLTKVTRKGFTLVEWGGTQIL